MDLPWKKRNQTADPPTPDPDDPEGKLEGKDPNQPQEPTSNEPPTGSESPFNDPEVAARITLMEATIAEQKRTIDAVPNVSAPVAVEPPPEPRKKIDSQDFFSDPAGSVEAVVSETVQKHLKEIIEPFKQDLAANRSRDAWVEAAGTLPNLAQMRPMIEAVLTRNKVISPTVGTIIAAYDMAVGQANRTGTNLPIELTPVAPINTPTPAPNVPPQHMPSTQPIVTETKIVAVEPLTENEARIARINNQTPEEYRSWQALDEADVLLPEVK